MLFKKSTLSTIGGTLEWFDFAIYAFFAPIFASLFFSHVGQSQLTSLIIAYGIFAIGFAARPIGGLIFGYIGDKYGRMVSLRITPLLSALTSISMALLPTYQQSGFTAIFLLILIRILQGIFIGGEFTGNIVYLCELSPNKKYFFGSIASCTGSIGILLASIVASVFYSTFSKTFMITYGWRIAFLLCVPLVLITFVTRLKLPESPEFKTKKTNPIKETFTSYKLKLISCLGLIYLHATSFYFVFMFTPAFLNKVRHFPEVAALVKNSIFLTFHIICIPIFGLLVNVIGGLRSTVLISLLFFLFSLPLFYFISFGSFTQITVSLLIFSIMTAFNAAIVPGLISKLIPSEIRYTVLALTFNIGFGIFGGIMPVFGLYLIHKTDCILAPSLYMMLASVITLITAIIVIKGNETRKIQAPQ